MHFWSFWFFKWLTVADLISLKAVFLVLCFTQVIAPCVSPGYLHGCYFSCYCHISFNCKLKRTKKKLQQFLVYIQEIELSTGTFAWYKYVRKPFSIVLWKLVRRPQWSTVHFSWMKPRETVVCSLQDISHLKN